MPMTSGRLPAVSRTPGRPPGANLALWLRADLGLTTNGITLTSPNDLTNPAWIPVGSSAVANATTDPVGGTNASSLVEDGSNGFHYILNIFTGWVTGRVTTLSVYAKGGSRNWFLLSGNGATDGSFFDVTNGVVGNTIGTILSKSMEPVGGGWFLCSITLVATAANIWLSLATGNGGSFPSYAGNGTGNTYFYGAAALQTKVSVWADQSGHGRDAVQASAANQPLYLATGANGAPTVAFDGVDDLMVTPSFTLPQPFGVWAVAKVTPQSPSANKDVVWAAGSNNVIWFADTTRRTILYAGNTTVGVGYVPAEGAYADLAGIVDDAVSVIRGDGTPLTPPGSPGANSGTGAFSIGGLVGATHQATVELAELIVLTSPTAADVAAVEAYLQDRYRLRPLPFVPAMLPGLVLWVRADLGVTLNAGNVSIWADQSGLGHNLAQATAANQPLWVSAGVNGAPTVLFDGVNDLLVGLFTLAAAKTELFTYKMVTRAGFPVYRGGATNTANGENDAGPGVNITETFTMGVAVDVANNVFAQQTNVISMPTSLIRVNGSLIVAGNAGASTNWGGVVLGGLTIPSNWANAAIAEYILYDRALSPFETEQVETYLRLRYATP
jgi:hypothetical protein